MRFMVAMLMFLALSVPDQASFAARKRGAVAPRISLQSLVAFSTPGKQKFRVTLLVDNLNEESVQVSSIEFKLRLANEGIIDGSWSAPIIVPALDRQTLTLEVSSDLISSLSRLLAFVQGPGNAIPYEIYGRITIGRRKLNPFRFQAMGEVPLVMSSAQ